jgi:regulator of sirC expression with transglutaminase-like and TPR domain
MGAMTDITTLGLLEDEEIALDHAALALSEIDHEGIDLDPYVALLDDIEDRLAEVGEEAGTPEEQAAALAQVFAEEFGFIGDAESYDAPLNADLIRVLDRRRGLPISLSLLYVAAARRVGWTAEVLNTPGHVLVRIGDASSLIVDPFNGGVPVALERLAALLHAALGPGMPVGPEHVAALSNRGILLRLLRNQALRAEQTADPVRALDIYARMAIVAPEEPDAWWELARMQLQLNDVASARHSLSAMLEVTRDPERRRLVTATLDAIAGG